MAAATMADLEAVREEFIKVMTDMSDTMSQRIDAITAEMQTVPGRLQGETNLLAQKLRNEFTGIIDGRAQVIERLVDMVNISDDKKRISKPFKPETLLPSVWIGDKDQVMWSEFVTDIRNWIQAEFDQAGINIID